MALTKEEHINLLGEIGTQSSRFFRRRASSLHPDRNPNNSAAESKFKSLNTFKEICNTPSGFVQYGEERTISMQYKSTFGPGDRERSATATLSVKLPAYKHPDLLANIKILYDLNDAQIENISQTLDNYLITFMQNIFYVKQPDSFEKIVYSHKRPDKDFMLLLKNGHLAPDNTLLITLINTLKGMPTLPWYSTFNEDVNAHVHQVSRIVNLYQTNAIFHANLLQIFLHLAYTHKKEQQKDFWPRYKKDIIELLGVVLKASLLLLEISFLLTLVFFSATMPLVLGACLGTVFGLPPIIVILPATAICICFIRRCAGLLDAYFDEITNQFASCSKFIDASLEKMFNVKFFATELAASLYEAQKIQPPVISDDTGSVTSDEPVEQSIGF